MHTIYTAHTAYITFVILIMYLNMYKYNSNTSIDTPNLEIL